MKRKLEHSTSSLRLPGEQATSKLVVALALDVVVDPRSGAERGGGVVRQALPADLTAGKLLEVLAPTVTPPAGVGDMRIVLRAPPSDLATSAVSTGVGDVRVVRRASRGDLVAPGKLFVAPAVSPPAGVNDVCVVLRTPPGDLAASAVSPSTGLGDMRVVRRPSRGDLVAPYELLRILAPGVRLDKPEVGAGLPCAAALRDGVCRVHVRMVRDSVLWAVRVVLGHAACG